MNRPTFEIVRQLLLDLGFQSRPGTGPHTVLEHPVSETVLILRAHRTGEIIDQGTLVGFRRLLDERGVIEGERFDELLREKSLAS